MIEDRDWLWIMAAVTKNGRQLDTPLVGVGMILCVVLYLMDIFHLNLI